MRGGLTHSPSIQPKGQFVVVLVGGRQSAPIFLLMVQTFEFPLQEQVVPSLHETGVGVGVFGVALEVAFGGSVGIGPVHLPPEQRQPVNSSAVPSLSVSQALILLVMSHQHWDPGLAVEIGVAVSFGLGAVV